MNEKKVTTTTVIEPHETTDSALHAKLYNAAAEIAHRAYAPYSQFRVGAAVLLTNGEIVTGNNQENAAYPSGLCAERVALFYANAQYPSEKVTHLMVYAETDSGTLKQPITPCGACRQVIIEKEKTQGKPIKILLAGADTIYNIASAEQLMPLSFIPTSLNNE